MSDELILCPYCMSPIQEDTVDCATCHLDTTNDAPFEMSPAEFEAQPRKTCVHCQSNMLKLAVVCSSCLKRQ